MSSNPDEGRTSRLSGFYQKSVAERTAIIARWADLTPDEVAALHDGLAVAQADKMIENVVGRYSLPLGIGANFLINGKEYLVPMVVEEPSVVAAVSVSSTPCSAGKRPVNSVERLGEHIAVLQNPFVKLSPVRASSAQLGISASTHPGSSGQCRGCRC